MITTDSVKQETALATVDAKDDLDAVRAFEITTPEQLELAREVIRDVKEKWRRLEDRRTEITKPMNASLKSVNDLFRPALTHYAQCEQVLKRKLAEALQRFAQAQQQALEQVNQLSAAGELEAARESLLRLPDAVSAPQGVTVRTLLNFEVVDETLVPREYLSVDADKVKAALQAGERDIPGIRVFEQSSVTVRR